jgi:poly(A) polymerase
MQKLQVGITPPISTKQPEEFELKATEKLIEELGKHGQYESKDEVQNRYQGITRKDVLAQIASIFKEFVKQVSIRNGLPEELASDVGGTIFTFGSYRLGVHGQGFLC